MHGLHHYRILDDLCEVLSDFSYKYPYITFKFRDTSLYSDIPCIVSIRNQQAFLIGEYLKTLSLSFPNLKRFAVLWRRWAHVSQHFISLTSNFLKKCIVCMQKRFNFCFQPLTVNCLLHVYFSH